MNMIRIWKKRYERLKRKEKNTKRILLNIVMMKTDYREWVLGLECDGEIIRDSKKNIYCKVLDFERLTSLYRGKVTQEMFETLCRISKDDERLCLIGEEGRNVSDLSIAKIFMTEN